MKKINFILLIPAMLMMNFSALAPELTKAERKTAAESLKKTKDDLLKSIKGLSAEQLSFKSSPESWSVAECVEHIAISETNLFGILQSTLKDQADPAKRSQVKLADVDVFNAISDRTRKVKTQEAFLPKGKFGTHEKTVQEFISKRDGTIGYIETTTDDLRNHFFTFPPEALGTVDSYQLLMFISGHTKRHTLQIEEVKSNAAFPKK